MAMQMRTALPGERMSLPAIRWAYWAPQHAPLLRWHPPLQSYYWSGSRKRGTHDLLRSTSGPRVFNRSEYRGAKIAAPAASADSPTLKEKHSRALRCVDAIPCKFTNADAAWI